MDVGHERRVESFGTQAPAYFSEVGGFAYALGGETQIFGSGAMMRRAWLTQDSVSVVGTEAIDWILTGADAPRGVDPTATSCVGRRL